MAAMSKSKLLLAITTSLSTPKIADNIKSLEAINRMIQAIAAGGNVVSEDGGGEEDAAIEYSKDDAVLAKEGKKWNTAVVQRVMKDGNIRVKFDDSEVVDTLDPSLVKPAEEPETSDGGEEPHQFVKGEEVEYCAEGDDDEWVPAIITSIKKKAGEITLIRINTDDEDDIEIEAEELDEKLRPLDAETSETSDGNGEPHEYTKDEEVEYCAEGDDDEWVGATVMRLYKKDGELTKIKIKTTDDEDEIEIDADELDEKLRPLDAEGSEGAEATPEFDKGDDVEVKVGRKWIAGEVVAVKDDGTIRVKVAGKTAGYDADAVRVAEPAPAPKKVTGKAQTAAKPAAAKAAAAKAAAAKAAGKKVTFKPGQDVKARLPDMGTTYWEGKVIKINPDGKVFINFLHGEKKAVLPASVKAA